MRGTSRHPQDCRPRETHALRQRRVGGRANPQHREDTIAIASGRGRSQRPAPISACGWIAQTGRSKKGGSQEGTCPSVRRLAETDANLPNSPLTVPKRAECLVERKRLWEEMYPEVKGDVAGATAR